MNLSAKINKLLEKFPDPRKGAAGKIAFDRTAYFLTCPPVLGIIVDNKDPDCLGRVRVQVDMLCPGAVTQWIPIVGQWKKKASGWWTLPELGTQCLVAFTAKDYSKGYVLGFIYDRKHLPPKHSTEKPTDSMLWQTKNHRMEFIDEDGKEEVRIESAEGQMRVVLNCDGGIQLINELGDINIKCKNLTVTGEDEIHMSAGKSFSAETQDALSVKAKGNFGLESDKDVTLKGKNIKMSGSKGVCAECKQIAVKGDKVMGFDTHIMIVQAGPGTTTVPIPHPFIGEMNDNLSEDVKISDKCCAYKGSKAKHQDSTMHMQMPGTISFQNAPKCEGEVTNGTSSKVKINGKEAAVLGSQLTTCNDVGMQNNSTIIAVGMAIPLPTIISPLATDQYKREKEEAEKKEPQFKNVKWGSTSVEEGEEVELTAGVKDIDDGNMVTLQVFPEGKGPEDSAAYAKFPLTVEGGSVSAKWLYKADSRELPPDTDPKFIFTAHCAWCNYEKSSNSLEVKLKRPEITKVEWQDKDGGSTSKGLVGEVLKMHAETKDLEGGVTFHVFDEHKREVYSVGAEIEGDKAEAEWTYHWNGIKLDHKPKFTITATGNRCKKVEGGEVEICKEIHRVIKYEDGSPMEETNYSIYLTTGDKLEGKTDKDGKIDITDLVPCDYELTIDEDNDNE